MYKISYIIDRLDDINESIPLYFRKDIRRNMFEIMTRDINKKYNQIGGGKREKKDFIEKYGDYKLNVVISKGDDDIIISIFTLGQKNPSACAVIYIMDGIATLSTLSHYENCTYPVISGKGGGTLLLRFILWFLKKNKK